MEFVFSSVKSIIMFLILVSIIMNLFSKSSFKQYISIFTGMVLIMIVIRPVMSLLNVEEKMNFYFDQNQFRINASDFTNELYHAETAQKERIIDEYKSHIREQIIQELKKHELVILSLEIQLSTDTESETCGEIEGIKITAETGTSNEKKAESVIEEIDQIAIDKVQINQQPIEKEEEEKTIQYDSVLELTIKKELVALYGININSIELEVREEEKIQ